MLALRQEHQDSDDSSTFLDDPYDAFRDPRRIVVEHRSGWFSHARDIAPISVIDDLSDCRHVGGSGGSNAWLTHGIFRFEFENIGNQQGSESSVFIEPAS